METRVKKTNEKASGTETAQANANVRKTTATKKVDLPSKLQDIKPVEEEKTKTPVEKVIKAELTLDQRIEKVENLKRLIEKRELLEDSRKKLNSFTLGANNFNESIQLTDENSNTFKTSNSEVFAKVVEVMNNTLVDKIKDVESQIEF